MNETDTSSVQELGKIKSELAEYLLDVKIGSPKFMSFWDLVDEDSAEMDIQRFSQANEELRHRSYIRAEFVANRIQSRRAETPGYDEAHRRLSDLFQNLAEAFGMYKEKAEASDIKKLQETKHQYLYSLRGLLAQKS